MSKNSARGIGAGVAICILAAAPAFAVSPKSGIGNQQAQLEFVPTSTVPAAKLRKQLRNPVSIGQQSKMSRTLPSPALPPKNSEETDLRTECGKHETEASSKTGWIKSRFESCYKRHYDLVLRDKQNKEQRGRLIFDSWVLGFTLDGSRQVDFVASVEDIQVATFGGEDATKWRIGQLFSHSIDASASDPDPKISGPSTEKRDELLGVWNSTPTWTLSYTSPDKGPLYSQGNAQKVMSTYDMTTTVNSPTVDPYIEVGSYQANVRFDYSGPVAGKFKGTVFTKARVELTMSLKDPEVNESALHIYDALKRPERTFPSSASKSVPGETQPLHRLVDAKKQADQRTNSIKECKKVWGDYSGTPLQCDEYPFASTHEGSLAGNGRYSVRLIEGSDNENGGSMLNSMYTLNRIIDGDAFFMKIVS
ncbi:NucA/NucB deoxyribonuclease domain-containing protein [Streptomyces sp. ScaeMP-e83]|uniref:NucA/NucB deoxyribonuclease domain-containing protein n=1 Tax=Streptomyces sp. ScaeMP-e83 TaxID=1758151 RepID=UPI00210BE86A|nr:NucA/NucB deoxyribonuclease domain-containing protein [Streptomyces sp. ScaeMP-e83]